MAFRTSTAASYAASSILAAVVAASAFISLAGQALAEQAPSLFKIITVKDEIVVGLSPEEAAKLGGADTAVIGKTLKADGTLTLWQYAVRKAADGSLEQAPLRKVTLLSHDTLRVEPYASPLRIAPQR